MRNLHIEESVEQGDASLFFEKKKRAEQGDADAQYILGEMYHLGRVIPQDKQEAVKWYKQSAENGHVEAQFALALIYHLGGSVPQPKKAVVRWYKQAAENGHIAA